ncbi:hypothetical protein EVI96_17630 [Salmonella enterica subsp. enterica serovar Kisangani]|nr:hypothetical protein [Salmonella enterica subsp. enterica serovar Kisangani]
MAKKWAEVVASPEYQGLSAPDKAAAQAQYFDQVVAPQLAPGDVDAAHTQFYQQHPIASQSAPQQAQTQTQATTAPSASEAATAPQGAIERGFNAVGEVAAGMGRQVAGIPVALANAGIGVVNTIGEGTQRLSNAITGETGEYQPIAAAGYGGLDKYLAPRGVEKIGSQIGAALLTAPLAGAETVATEAAPLLTRLAGAAGRNAAGSIIPTMSEHTTGKDSDEALSDLALNTLTGMGLEGIGNGLIKAGSAARRAIMGESRTADALREGQIANLADDYQAIQQNAPTLAGKTPKEILENPQIVDSFRKPGENAVIPERLDSALRGMFGHDHANAMIEAAEKGAAPKAASKDWQSQLDARWNMPISDQVAGNAGLNAQQSFAALERQRPEISMQRLQELNEAYRKGGFNAPLIDSSLINPSIQVGKLSEGTLARLGVGKGEALLMRGGEGLENNMFGLGQLTRYGNQKALDKAAFGADSEAMKMAGRKTRGSQLAQDDYAAMSQQHDQLSQQLQPAIDQYDTVAKRQRELLDQLDQPLKPDELQAVQQELTNVSDQLNQLEPAATNAQFMLDQSASELAKQAEKARDMVKISNAYGKAAKQGDAYRSTRGMSNREAGTMLEAEQLSSGGKTKGYDESAYTEQATPRELQEAREETAALAAKQRGSKQNVISHAMGSAITGLHYATSLATTIPHLLAVGYSRSHANAIMRDLERSGGKNLTGDELRNVLGSLTATEGATTAQGWGTQSRKEDRQKKAARAKKRQSWSR